MGGGSEGKGDGRDEDDNVGDDNSGSGRTGAGGIFGRVRLIHNLHGNVPHHKRASTLCAFGNEG